MSWFEKLLRRFVSFKEIGWTEIGEKFTRYKLIDTRFGSLYLHQLYAPNWHPHCHDHPWSFVTLLLKRGYLEEHNGELVTHKPWKILYRAAEFSHNVVTPTGTSWSLVAVGPKRREWGYNDFCERSFG